MEINISPAQEQMMKLLYDAEQNGNNGLTTSEFKSEMGIPNGSVHHHYKQLKEAGLITLTDAKTNNNRTPPKLASLTEKAREEIRKGMLGSDIFDKEENKKITLPRTYVENLQDDIETLEHKFQALHEQHQETKAEQEKLRDALTACFKALQDNNIDPNEYR